MSLLVPSNSRGPILDLTLPASEDAIDIVLRNVTTGKQLAVNLPAGWDGDDLTLDFYRRTIKDQTGADRSALLDPGDNELWTPEPLIAGANDVQVEALAGIQSSTRSPGTVADDAGIGTEKWTNPSNAKSSDNTYAAILFSSVGATSHYLKATNYGFSATVPSGATILGVAVPVERKASEAGKIADKAARLVKGGVIQAHDEAKAGAWGVGDEVVSYGSSSSTWEDESLEASDIRNESFGFALAAGNTLSLEAASVDHMPMTVYFRPPASAYAATAVLRWEKGYY